MRERGDVIDPVDLMAVARAEPSAALARGKTMLDELAVDEDADRSRVLRAMSIAARVASTMEESIGHAHAAAAAALAAEDPDLHSEAQMTLAGSLAINGDMEQALQVIDQAIRSSSGLLRAQLEFQRGAVLTVMGEFDAALGAYSSTLPVFRDAGDEESEAQALKNRGLLLTRAGRLDEAESDLMAAREIHTRLGAETEVAGTDHNLGMLAAYRGDIPDALRRLISSENSYMALSGSRVPNHPTRSEVLISVGLFGEALDLARRIAVGSREAGRNDDEADALLVAAQAAQLQGDSGLARRLAGSARDIFTRQRRQAAAASARLVELEGRYEVDGSSAQLREETSELADRLEQDHLMVAAANARLLSARVAIDLGHVEQAKLDLESVAGIETGPVELRLQARVAEALLRGLEDSDIGVEDAAARGLDLLDDYQVAVGATDLRTGLERRASELGAIGLDIASKSGDAMRVLQWMERTRARALRQRPVSPPADDALRQDLSELRFVTEQLRTHQDSELVQRQRQLQDSLRQRSHVLRGGDAARRTSSPESLIEGLGEVDLIEFGDIGGELWRVQARGGDVDLAKVGPVPEIRREVEHLRFSMKRAAHRDQSEKAPREGIGRLDTLLFGGASPSPGPVVVVPTPWLMAVPWSPMPSLSGRELTVAPSAEMWWRAKAGGPSDGVILAAGPDLTHAGAEISALAGLYPEAEILATDAATVDAVLSRLGGVATAHIACHARFQVDNPMFSALRLTDGDLNVYDIERLETPPSLMVLSACDSGYSGARPGEELMGLTSALLGIGTRSVVASIGLVPDSPATMNLMTELHRRLLEGLEPAAALAGAQQEAAATPEGYLAAATFICVGAG